MMATMLTEENIDKLNALINEKGGDDRDKLLQAMDELSRVIANQALVTSVLSTKLLFLGAGADALNALVDENSVANLIPNLGSPKQNSFTMQEAIQASENLAQEVEHANNFADIFKTVAQVARVFI